MIKLPDFEKPFEYENGFYLTSSISRLSKPLIHYELYKQTVQIPGAFAEFGVFKGASFIRFLAYRSFLETGRSRRFIGFDTFGSFPDATLDSDKVLLDEYLKAAGDQSISKEQLLEVIRMKGVDENVELVEGDIATTVPTFVKDNPSIRFSFIHLDVDVYQPSVIVLEYLYPLLSVGGVLVLDDYGVWEGETRAVDEYFKDQAVSIRRFPFAPSPVYIIKDSL